MHDHDHDQWHIYGPSTGKTEADKNEPWSSLGLSQVKQPGLPYRDHQVRRSTAPLPPAAVTHRSSSSTPARRKDSWKMAVDYVRLDEVVSFRPLYPVKLLSSLQ